MARAVSKQGQRGKTRMILTVQVVRTGDIMPRNNGNEPRGAVGVSWLNAAEGIRGQGRS